jgi:hypothetical protein
MRRPRRLLPRRRRRRGRRPRSPGRRASRLLRRVKMAPRRKQRRRRCRVVLSRLVCRRRSMHVCGCFWGWRLRVLREPAGCGRRIAAAAFSRCFRGAQRQKSSWSCHCVSRIQHCCYPAGSISQRCTGLRPKRRDFLNREEYHALRSTALLQLTRCHSPVTPTAGLSPQESQHADVQLGLFQCVLHRAKVRHVQKIWGCTCLLLRLKCFYTVPKSLAIINRKARVP